MKRIFIAILIGGIFCVLTVLTAGMKEKKRDDFLRINDNIQNEELRIELAGLREEFKIERKRIREYYNVKMEVLKETQRNEIKTIKADFSVRREVLMKKYVGKMRNKSPIRHTEPDKNLPEKKMTTKNKKKIRQP